MFLYPDNPVPVSLDYLKRIDNEPPGTYLASPKMDGWRRFASKTAGAWQWRSKPGGSNSLKAMPADLQAEFEALPWPDGITLDMEWVGPRGVMQANPEHRLYVFDLIAEDGERHTGGFIDRLCSLSDIIQGATWFRARERSPRIHIMHFGPSCGLFQNPGLVERFKEQMQNPLSEGLVVRRADSKIIGHPTKCVDNAHCLKIKFRDVRRLLPLGGA